jgi:hypothetical protein
MMKKLLVMALVSMVAGSAMADTGWFDDFFTVSVNGGAGVEYQLDGTPATPWDGANLGSVYSMTLTEIDMSYWSDTQDRGGGSMFYQIFENANPTPVVSATEVIWTQASLGGNDYQGTWTGTEDMMGAYSYVEDETYFAQVWAKSWDTGGGQGDSFLNNGGDPANYEASFTYNAEVIPEPATMSLLGLGALAMVLRRKMKK